MIAIRNIIHFAPSRFSTGNQTIPRKIGITPTYNPIRVKLSRVAAGRGAGGGGYLDDMGELDPAGSEQDDLIGFAFDPWVADRDPASFEPVEGILRGDGIGPEGIVDHHLR